MNKGIGNIEYNHLNLPTKITFQLPMTGEYIEYTYDATGVKLEKAIQYSNTIGQSRTQYDGSFIYEYTGAANPELKFFSHPEGYFEPTGTSPLGEMEGAYVYQYKDHSCLRRLTEVRRDGEEGTVRLSYKDSNNNGSVSSSEIVEENNYYPFGLKHKGYNNVVNGADHKFGFGGKEENDELGLEWLDFGARNYDASLGRWMNLDPLAEHYFNFSPFVFTFNNPIVFVDPDGMRVKWAEGLNGDEKQLLGYAIYFLRKNSESFNKAFEELHSSEMVFSVGKSNVEWGNYMRPGAVITGGGEDEEDNVETKVQFMI